MIIFSQNRAEYEKRVRSQAAKFPPATWWMEIRWYIRLETCTCRVTITSRRIYFILIFTRKFQWKRSCNKNVSLLHMTVVVKARNIWLSEIMSVLLGRLHAQVLFHGVQFINLYGQMVESWRKSGWGVCFTVQLLLLC